MRFLREFNMGFLLYLKKNNILDDQKILDGMSYQFNHKRPLLDILKKHEKLNTEKLIELLDLANEKNKSLLQVLKESSLLTDDEIGDVLDQQVKESKGLAQWIIDQGHLSSDKMIEVIENYKSDKTPSPASEDTVREEEKAVESEASTNDSAFNAAALESLADLGISADELMEDTKPSSEPEPEDSMSTNEESSEELNINSDGQLKTFFTDEKKTEINGLIKKLALGFNADKVKEIHTEIYKLLGVSKMCEQKLLIKNLESQERLLEAIIAEQVDFTVHNFSSVLKEIKTAVKIAWELKDHLLIQGNVKKYLSEGSSKEEYLTNIENMLKISQKG